MEEGKDELDNLLDKCIKKNQTDDDDYIITDKDNENMVLSIQCLICKELPDEYREVTCCDSSFCANCIEKMEEPKICPICSTEFEEDTVRENSKIQKIINDKYIKCEYCDTFVHKAEYTDHMISCEDVPMKKRKELKEKKTKKIKKRKKRKVNESNHNNELEDLLADTPTHATYTPNFTERDVDVIKEMLIKDKLNEGLKTISPRKKRKTNYSQKEIDAFNQIFKSDLKNDLALFSIEIK